MFKRGTNLSSADAIVQHLFECCDSALGNAIIQTKPAVLTGTETELLALIKQLTVIPVARVVRRTELTTHIVVLLIS
jgi:hypothetical protein